jgi:uncharacterized protein
MTRRFFLFLLAVATAVAVPGTLLAADVAGAKDRMRQRVPAIDQLKLGEVVGENNRGYLELRQQEGNAASVVQAENADRAVVFQDTANRTGSTADAVGRTFAKQVAAASAPGVWIQREDGSWSKK